MAQVLFINFSDLNGLEWYINTATGPKSAPLRGSFAATLPANALSIGWKTTSRLTVYGFWRVNGAVGQYAYYVYAQAARTTIDQRHEAMQAALGDDAGDVDEVAAVVAVSAMWTNNSASAAQWGYGGPPPNSGIVQSGSSVTKALPTTQVECGWNVSGFQGRMLRIINQTNQVRFTLDNNQK
jgi:hypothetical protein